MEYVTLVVCIALPLVLGSKALFNPSGDYKSDFGLVGTSYHQFYTNLVTGIGQPVP
ncbi:MAG: hypothetical protein WCL11_25290 [Verrucomicrobiota bacterium]